MQILVRSLFIARIGANTKYNDKSGKGDRKGGPRNGGRKLGKRGHAQGRYPQRPAACQKTPEESARGRKPFRGSIVPGGVYGGDGAIFAAEIPFSRAKIASLQFPRPKIRRILAETGEGGSGGGARSARPVGEAARSKPNEQGSTASRQAQQDDHCELWRVYSPVHRLVKKTFLTS